MDPTNPVAARAGPADGPLAIDVDSTICQVYGTRKQGAEFGHTKVRGYHPLLAFCDNTVRHEALVRREALGVEGGGRPSRRVVAAARSKRSAA